MTTGVSDTSRPSFLHLFLFINLIIVVDSINILLIPLRLLEYVNIAVIFVPIAYVIGVTITILSLKKLNFFRLNVLEFLIVLIPFLLLPISIMNNNSIKYIIADSIKPLLFVGVISYFRYEKDQLQEIVRPPKTNDGAIYFMFVLGFVSTIFTAFLFFARGGFHLSASDPVYSLTSFFFLLTGRYLLFLISLSVFIIGGKVGAFAGIMFALAIYFFLNHPLKSFLVTFFAVILLLAMPPSMNQLNKLPLIQKVSYTLDPGSFVRAKEFDRFVLGGRYVEIKTAMAFLEDDWYYLFTGKGPGYTYDWKFYKVIRDAKHNVHFSPVSLLTTYGIIYLIIIYFYLFVTLIKCLKILRSPPSLYFPKVMAFIFIVIFISSFTSFTIFTTLIFSVAIGIINNKHILEGTASGT